MVMSKYDAQERFYPQMKRPGRMRRFLSSLLPFAIGAIIVAFIASVLIYAEQERSNHKRLEMILSTDFNEDPTLQKADLITSITIVINGEQVRALENVNMYPKYQREADIGDILSTRVENMLPGTRILIREDKDLLVVPVVALVRLTDGYLCGVVLANIGENKYAPPLLSGDLNLIAAGNRRDLYACITRSLGTWR
jgi:hypothetical protein